jgi:hypothetical protein
LKDLKINDSILNLINPFTMAEFIRSRSFNRIVSGILIIAVLNLMNGCYYYKVTRAEKPPEPTIVELQTMNKYFILHVRDKVWHFTDIVIDGDAIKGKISVSEDHAFYKTTNPNIVNRYRKSRSFDDSRVINEVHVYITEYKESTDGSISFPASSVSKIEIYDPAAGATTASWIFSILGIAAGTLGLILIIAILTKSSCPFIYAYDGTNYIFAGEIFSGATQPGLERDDYLLLPALRDRENSYKLKITNEVHEIQSIDQAELIIADHRDGMSVLMDRNGTLHTVTGTIAPAEARNGTGNNILPLVRSKDTLFYAGDEKAHDKKAIEEIIMKFPRPVHADSAKLIIRAKNDFWLDALFTKFHGLFGEKYEEFSRNQEAASGEKLRKWSFNQHIPLSVYLEKNGSWKFIDYFNIAGPMAFRDDVLAFSLDGVDQDTINLKLDYGFLFWDIDYVAMDCSADAAVKVFTMPVASATGENGTDLRQLLGSADHRYYVQDKVGNEARLSFDKPVLSGQLRTIILHTKGHYKILREQKGKPDKKVLKTFRHPGRFPEFSKEMFEQTKAK